MSTPRVRSRLRVNWAAITTAIVALFIGVCIGMALQFAIMSPLLERTQP